jgi:hypothetical protein
MVSKNVAINIGIANLFTDADVQSDYIISREVDLPLLEVLLMFLILRKLLRLLKHTCDLVVKSNKGSTRTLIPAIVTDINNGVSDPMVTNDVPGFSDN